VVTQPSMLRGLRSFAPLAGLLAFVSLAPGCKQHSGDRCELDSDCSDGLTCDFVGNTDQHSGFCTANPGAHVPIVDAATAIDVPEADAAAVDGGADVAPADVVEIDAATADVGADVSVDISADVSADVSADTSVGVDASGAAGDATGG
jgi:hypothetical protein